MLRTRSPLIPGPKPGSPFDLHVLGAPPAFVLSQDQTLRRDRPEPTSRSPFDLMEVRPSERGTARRAFPRQTFPSGRMKRALVPRHGEPCRCERWQASALDTLFSSQGATGATSLVRAVEHPRELRRTGRIAVRVEASTGPQTSNRCSSRYLGVNPPPSIPASRANFRRPTCHTDPTNCPGGSPLTLSPRPGSCSPLTRTPPCACSRLRLRSAPRRGPCASSSAGT